MIDTNFLQGLLDRLKSQGEAAGPASTVDAEFAYLAADGVRVDRFRETLPAPPTPAEVAAAAEKLAGDVEAWLEGIDTKAVEWSVAFFRRSADGPRLLGEVRYRRRWSATESLAGVLRAAAGGEGVPGD